METLEKWLKRSSDFVDRHLRRLTTQYGRWLLFVSGMAVLIVTWIASRASLDSLGPRSLPGDVSALTTMADLLLSLVAISLLVGVVTSAVVEIFKNVTTVRGWFHRNEIAKYLGEGLRHKYDDHEASKAYLQLVDALGRSTLFGYYEKEPLGYYEKETKPDSDEERFFSARNSRDLRYIFNLPLEQLAAQLSAAAELAITDEVEYAAFLGALDGGGSPPPNVDHVDREEAYRARALRAQRVQRGIDVLQIVIGHRWRWFLRVLAIFVAGPIAVVSAQFSATTGSARSVAVVVSALLGGYFAWLVRDLTASVQRLRR